MIQRYAGKIPSRIDYKEIDSYIINGDEWSLFIEREYFDWAKVKLIRHQKKKGKANYHLAFNGKRFARNKESMGLMEKNELYLLVEGSLIMEFNNSRILLGTK